jgi:hypothetical protein
MRNPFSGQQGIAMMLGIFVAILSFAAVALNVATDIVSRVSGLLVLASILVLFVPKYRPWGKGFLIGSIGLLVIVGIGSFLISFMILALHRP